MYIKLPHSKESQGSCKATDLLKWLREVLDDGVYRDKGVSVLTWHVWLVIEDSETQTLLFNGSTDKAGWFIHVLNTQ